jgi:histidyl-tRNA synthetase
VLGESELAKGVVTVKDLQHGEQSEVARATLVDALRAGLAVP